MTDPTDDRRWLRDHVDPILDAEPVAPGWAAIADRLDGVAPAPTPVPEPTNWGRGRTILAVAAAVALLAGAVLAIRAVTDDDTTDPADVRTTEPEATGWYVPERLPEGWSLLGVDAYPGDPTCDRQGTQWSDPGGGRSVGVSFDACGRAPTEADLPGADLDDGEGPLIQPEMALRTVDLGDGTTASAIVFGDDTEPLTLLDPGRTRSLSWDAPDGGAWRVGTVGFTDAELVEVAQAIAAAPGVDLAGVVAGDLDQVDRWQTDEASSTPSVEVRLQDPAGDEVSYQLAVPGTGVKPAGDAVLVPETVDGQPLDVFRYDSGTAWAVRFGGSWPGADLSVLRIAESESNWPDDDVLREVIGALRPATAERWRTFLDTATGTVTEQARTAPTLRTLFDPATVAPDDPTTPEDPSRPTTAVPSIPTVELPDAPEGWLQSTPATLVDREGGGGNFSSLAGAVAWVEVPRDRVPAGDTLPARLAVWNLTDADLVVEECSDLLTTWGLVPASAPGSDLPGRTIIDCYATPSHEIPAGEVVRWDLTWTQIEPGFVARTTGDGPEWPHLGALDPGSYLGVVELPTSEGDLRMSIPITVTEPRCEGLTDDLVERYVGRTGEEASIEASQGGFTYRVASIDGEPLALTDDLVCDRIDVDLINGTVARVSLG